MNILYHGDSPAVATGFGNVSKNLLGELAKNHPDWDITVIAINDRGGWKDPKEFPYRVYPAILNDYTDLFGMKRVLMAIAGVDAEIAPKKYDVLIMQYDFFLLAETHIGEFNFFQQLKMECAKNEVKKKILYTPIDNPLIRPHWLEVLDWFDEVVVPSKYGYDVLEAKWGKKKTKEKVKIVYYGIDTDQFIPDDALKETIRQKISADVANNTATKLDLSKKFIIGYVGRNQWRKDLYRLIKVFTIFKATHPNAYLYIHTDPLDTAHDGGNIMDLLADHGQFIYKDYLTPVGLNINVGLKRAEMNELYNMMDVFLSCSTAEGLGLPYIEAMLAGTPVIAPDNTTVPEILGENRGLIYKTDNTVCFGSVDFMRERQLGDIGDALLKLEWLFKNRDNLKDMTTNARQWALKHCNAVKMAADFDWSIRSAAIKAEDKGGEVITK